MQYWRMPSPAAAPQHAHRLLAVAILPILLRFALPNVGAMLATALAAIAETTYVGSFGVSLLAGMALVFPLVMLQGMLSAGAMGGGVSSAVSRALGAGDPERANALAVHATIRPCKPTILRALRGSAARSAASRPTTSAVPTPT